MLWVSIIALKLVLFALAGANAAVTGAVVNSAPVSWTVISAGAAAAAAQAAVAYVLTWVRYNMTIVQ
jgi:hypothetical protein